jgi:hypothetical protein
MGVVVVKESGTRNPATEAPTVEAAATEEEAEIEEIIRPEEEKVAPQCVRIVRKRGDEWVFYEEDHSDRAVRKTIADSRRPDGPNKGKSTRTPIFPIKLLLRNCYF